MTNKIRQFPDQNAAESAVDALSEGLHLTLQKFPFLAGTLSLANDDSGRLALRYPTEVSAEDMSHLFQSKQIPFHEKSFPYTYEQLRREGMPPSAFHAAVFVPDDFANYPGIPEFGEGFVDFNKSDAPAMRIQACFIPGGLALSMYIHHTVMDCSGVTTFWTAFSANVSKVSGKRELSCDELYGMCGLDRPSLLLHNANFLRFSQRSRSPVITASSARGYYALQRHHKCNS